MKLKTLDSIALILTIVGGLNWGLVGFFKYNLVEVIFGRGATTGVVYMIVGLAALYSAVIFSKLEKR